MLVEALKGPPRSAQYRAACPQVSLVYYTCVCIATTVSIKYKENTTRYEHWPFMDCQGQGPTLPTLSALYYFDDIDLYAHLNFPVQHQWCCHWNWELCGERDRGSFGHCVHVLCHTESSISAFA